MSGRALFCGFAVALALACGESRNSGGGASGGDLAPSAETSALETKPEPVKMEVKAASPGRVLIVGIDGATLRVAEPLLQAGRLPHLARIAREGVMGPLRSQFPIRSPRIWNSIATGKSADKHGIVDFTHKEPDGTRRLLLSTDRRTHTVWNIASDAGLDVAVVNWWNTYPPERVRGVMVSDHMLAREVEGREAFTGADATPTGSVVYPESWQTDLSARMRDGAPLVDFPDPFTRVGLYPFWAQPRILQRRFREDGAIAAFAHEIVRRTEPRLTMVLLPGIDRVSHHLWAVLEPEELYPEAFHTTPQKRETGEWGLKRYYEYTDTLIGELVGLYGPDDLVIVLSDHGFEAGVELMVATGVHQSEEAIDGLLFARGRGIAPGGSTSGLGIYDVTPTVLAWLGLPVGEDMDGRVAPFLGPPRAERVARVPTHDTGPVERITTDPSGVDETLIDQLRALGYFE